MSEIKSVLPDKPDDDTTIWRYMDFTQFISLLENKQLWFTQLDQFDDPYEGALSDINIKTLEQRYEDAGIPTSRLKRIFASQRKLLYANCWHKNEYESAAMWDLYINGSQGVVIKSTVEKLSNAFKEEYEPSYIRPVKYINYSKDIIPERNLFSTAFYKRASFAHENEIRAVFGEIDAITADSDKSVNDLPAGKPINIDMNELTNQIRVSPTAKNWFSDLVSDTLSTYEVEFEIMASGLNDRPML